MSDLANIEGMECKFIVLFSAGAGFREVATAGYVDLKLLGAPLTRSVWIERP